MDQAEATTDAMPSELPLSRDKSDTAPLSNLRLLDDEAFRLMYNKFQAEYMRRKRKGKG
jgi:hypothetical protein